jgi:hypothetical protein
MPAMPLMMRAGRLVVAVEDPSSRRTSKSWSLPRSCKVVPVLARTGVLLGAIDRAYEKVGSADFAAPGRASIEAGNSLDYEPGDASKLLASMETRRRARRRRRRLRHPAKRQLAGAADQLDDPGSAQPGRVRHPHRMCAGRDKVRIRFRKDGLLHPYLELPHTYRSAVIGRLKVMCDLDISEKRKPQDGKINFARYVQGVRLELRVATIPTQNNLEDAVLRLLASSKPLPLDSLGLSPHNLDKFQAAAQRPYGMLLCVGPTGSGKTTTLHSLLAMINTPERKIWTAEDPVEITQAGCARCRSTRASTGPLPRPCAPSCVPTRT